MKPMKADKLYKDPSIASKILDKALHAAAVVARTVGPKD